MNLTFNKINDVFVSEFSVTSDFNLHVERSKGGSFTIFQRSSDGGNYGEVYYQEKLDKIKAIDYDFSALIYPKYIKIVSEVEPTYAAITTDGEVTEIKTQSKEIEITSNGITDITPDAGFAYLNSVKVKTNVPTSGGGGSAPSASKWTGHADVEGLKAIGWTDEDIAYYQAHGVNWNAEDDEYHKVSDDNKALYGVLTAENISDYETRIVYLPKIDTSGVDEMYGLLYYCENLVAIPSLDLSNCTDLSYAFNGPTFLASCSPFDTSKSDTIESLFDGCKGLLICPNIDMNGKNINSIFNDCYSLEEIKVKAITGATDIGSTFSCCYSLKSIPLIDMSGVTKADYAFNDCFSLVNAKLKNLKVSISFAQSPCLSKESLLYIINNEAATSPIVITLAKYSAYERLSVDPDITAALANHPNVSLAK